MIDPVRAKLVESLARPGGNITGLTGEDPDLSAERLQLVSELAPGLSRVAVLATTAPTAAVALREAEAAARSLGMQLQPVIVQRPDDFDAAYAAMARGRAEALIVLPDRMFDQHRFRLTELALNHRLPAMYYGSRWIDAGGLMFYGVSYADRFRRAAHYADRIMKSASPAELPIETSTTFELHINLKAAHGIGVSIPPALLAWADKVIASD
jgi:putative ABC transport system substrate-binding protein